MNNTLITIVVIGAVAVAGYYVYTSYSSKAALNTNTVSVGGVLGGLGIAGNLNLNTLSSDLGSIFGGSDN
jgi:hypothetical protein